MKIHIKYAIYMFTQFIYFVQIIYCVSLSIRHVSMTIVTEKIKQVETLHLFSVNFILVTMCTFRMHKYIIIIKISGTASPLHEERKNLFPLMIFITEMQNIRGQS